MTMELLYQYDGSFDGFLCCIFDSYAFRESPTGIFSDPGDLLTLFQVRVIRTDLKHSGRVLKKLCTLSPYGAKMLRCAFLTCMEDREMTLFRFAVQLIDCGSSFLKNQADPIFHPVFRAVRHLTGEAHLLKGFVRFSDLGGVLCAEIEPKNRVLPLLRSHFCARYREDTFFIYDRTHKEALFHAGGQSVIRHLDEFQMAPPDGAEAKYRLLWKRFYETVAIKERENPRCRQTHMPKRYWATMTEFQPDACFTPAQASPADAAVPGFPGATPALETRP